jgi:hypothetical protein
MTVRPAPNRVNAEETQLSSRVAAQTVYLLYASDNNQNFKISHLDSTYLNVQAQVSVLPGRQLLNILGLLED